MIENLEVSEIGIGTMGFSHGYGEVPGEEYMIIAVPLSIQLKVTGMMERKY